MRWNAAYDHMDCLPFARFRVKPGMTTRLEEVAGAVAAPATSSFSSVTPALSRGRGNVLER